MSCKECGLCCKAIVSAPPGRVKAYRDKPIRENWEPITIEQAAEINPYLVAKVGEEAYYYKCKLLTEDNKCPLHMDDKPPVCKNFPYYGRNYYNKGDLYTPDCGYWDGGRDEDGIPT